MNIQSRRFIQITLLVLTAAVGVWISFRIYESRKISRQFPYKIPFYVSDPDSGNAGESFAVHDGNAIVVMRNPGSNLFVSLGCSRKWGWAGKQVEVSFQTEDKQLGKESFQWMTWHKSFSLDSRTLGSSSFLKIVFRYDEHAVGILKVKGCTVRTNLQHPKILILALDGITWRMLDPLVRMNKCPNFKKLVQEGVYGTLTSEDPTYSPVIWTTLATGRPPSDHGVSFYVARNKPVTSQTIRVKRFWNIFSEFSDLNSLVVAWYLTWPVEKIHGAIISDRSHYISRTTTPFYPDDLFDKDYYHTFSKINLDLEKQLLRFSSFHFDRRYQKKYPPGTSERLVSQIMQKRLAMVFRRDASYGQFGLKLFSSLNPDVFVLYLRGADFTQHGFWKYMDPQSVPFFPVTQQEQQWLGSVIENYYQYLDEVLGEFLQAGGKDATIFVLSDHGFQPIPKESADNPELSGAHEVDGVILCKGPAFRKGFKISQASIYDFLPTLLYVAGLPPAEDMPGKILTEAMDPTYLRQHAVRRIKSYGAREGVAAEDSSTGAVDEEIKDELRSLGYIH